MFHNGTRQFQGAGTSVGEVAGDRERRSHLGARGAHDLDLASLSVIADAVTTPYQAIERSGLGEGDLAIFVGAGGVGGFGVQIAAARAASVVAIDVDSQRLELVAAHGADLVLDSAALDFRELRRQIRSFAAEREIILVCTYIIVIFSIAVQGLTLKPLIKRVVKEETGSGSDH